MTIFLTVLAVLSSLFAVLSIINGAIAATGLYTVSERYHTFAQRMWLVMSILFTVAVYVILFGVGLA
jgi:hypothetical protein